MAVEHLVTAIPTASCRPSLTNPNGRMSGRDFDELVASVRAQGVLQPILVRPRPGSCDDRTDYEIVFGHRRHAAARAAELDQIPAIVRELSDLEALELQVVENLQRADVHPLDEAAAYAQLNTVHKQTVAAIAAKIGRTPQYVYDRLNLHKLIPDLQRDFREGKFTAGHAVLLARLSAKDQKRAIGDVARMEGRDGGLYEGEHTLFDPSEANGDDRPHVKARSVTELKAWIDEHVRLAPAEADPMLFPATEMALQAATATKDKVVGITKLGFVPTEARDGKTYFPKSWKRADGQRKSKPCDHAVTGFVVVGPGRGDAFKVCIAKDRCTTHWGAEIAAKKKRAAAAEKASSSGSGKKGEAKPAPARPSYEIERERQEAFKRRWAKVLPELLKQVGAAVAKASTSPSGVLAQTLVRTLTRGNNAMPAEVLRLAGAGTDANATVRRLAMFAIYGDVCDYDGQYYGDFKAVKALGVDPAKLLKAQIEAEKKAEAEKQAAAAKEKKTREPSPAESSTAGNTTRKSSARRGRRARRPAAQSSRGGR